MLKKRWVWRKYRQSWYFVYIIWCFRRVSFLPTYNSMSERMLLAVFFSLSFLFRIKLSLMLIAIYVDHWDCEYVFFHLFRICLPVLVCVTFCLFCRLYALRARLQKNCDTETCSRLKELWTHNCFDRMLVRVCARQFSIAVNNEFEKRIGEKEREKNNKMEREKNTNATKNMFNTTCRSIML